MLDIGWSELLVIGVVALIVIGPKDLPRLFHSLGRVTAKARAMAREFSTAMEEAAKDSGLDEATKDLRDLKSMTSKKNLGLDALDRAADKFEKWTPKVPSAGTAARAGTAGAASTTAAKAAGEPAEEVVTFRSPPKDPPKDPPKAAQPAPAPTGAASPPKPVRRTSAKTRKARPEDDA